jgi:hypothetical protein
MYFTLIFSDNGDGPIPKYDLAFHSSPIWIKDGVQIINSGLDSGEEAWGPEYKLGYLQGLVDKEGLDPDTYPNVAICAHPGSHGTEKDLELLLEDIQNHNFGFTVVTL